MSILQTFISYISQATYYIFHIDTFLFSFVLFYGQWAYLLLFVIIFFETGVVITPFLPGDSLLFISGTIAAQSSLSISILFLILASASIFGYQLNFYLGRYLGLRLINFRRIKLLNAQHIIKTHNFYTKYGGRTIVFARFLPIIRTVAPFVAGMANMEYHLFFLYNIISGLLWVGSLLLFGYFCGSLPFVKENFSLVIYGIIAISLMPLLSSLLRTLINFRSLRAKKQNI